MRSWAPLAAATLAAAVLAGCAGTATPPGRLAPAPKMGTAPGAVPGEAPDLTVTLDVAKALAEGRVEALAARCWLAGPLADGVMLVDRRAGTLTVEDDAGLLLAIALAEPVWGTTEVALTGRALATPEARARYRADLRRAVEAGEEIC